MVAAAHEVASQKRLLTVPRMWEFDEHLEGWQASPDFSFTKSIYFHDEIEGNARDFMGWARATGVVRGVLREGVAEEEIGMPCLTEVAAHTLGDHPRPWFTSYRIIVGRKKAAAVNG